MSQTPKFLDIGVIRQYEYKGDNGEPVQRFSVALNSNVDIYVEGRKVDFQRKEVGDKVYFEKNISAKPIEDEIARINANDKLSLEAKTDMVARLKKRSAIFVLTIPPKAQQQ